MKSHIKFKKSSLSENYTGCVGVAKKEEKILVTNTKNLKPVVKFTKTEWEAFLKGIKEGEFDEFLK